MNNLLSKEEVEAQLGRKKEQISHRFNELKHDAEMSGKVVRARAGQIKDRARGNAALAGGGALAVAMVSKMIGRDRDGVEPGTIPQQVLTDNYVASLAKIVEHRLQRGEGLADALAEVLRERAPLLLVAPRSRHFSLGRWLVGAGLLGAACLWAYRRLTAEEGKGYEIDQKYPVVHDTAGARMPDPKARSGADGNALGASGSGGTLRTGMNAAGAGPSGTGGADGGGTSGIGTSRAGTGQSGAGPVGSMSGDGTSRSGLSGAGGSGAGPSAPQAQRERAADDPGGAEGAASGSTAAADGSDPASLGRGPVSPEASAGPSRRSSRTGEPPAS